MAEWNIKDKTVVVTGATSGIGDAASVALARLGARVVMVGRDPKKTEAAVAEVMARGDSREVTHLLCDFSSQAAIRRCAAEALAKLPRIDVLINNAGGVNKSRVVTEDGIEATFAVNHLGPYLFTRLLLDRITASAPARIVNVASVGHRRGTMNFEDLGFEKGYSIIAAYGRSKLGNVLFTNELSRRLQYQGVDVTVNSLHPGAVATNIWSGAPAWSKPFITLFAKPFFISPEQGGQTLVHLAVDPALAGITGQYFEKNGSVPPSRLALDVAVQKRLWEESEKLVKWS